MSELNLPATVTAEVDATDGRRIIADLEVTGGTKLGCGCTRLECVRPGPETDDTRRWTEATGRPPMVHILTGCGVHPDGRWRQHNGPTSPPSDRDLEEMDPHRCTADMEEVQGL